MISSQKKVEQGAAGLGLGKARTYPHPEKRLSLLDDILHAFALVDCIVFEAHHDGPPRPVHFGDYVSGLLRGRREFARAVSDLFRAATNERNNRTQKQIINKRTNKQAHEHANKQTKTTTASATRKSPGRSGRGWDVAELQGKEL